MTAEHRTHLFWLAAFAGLLLLLALFRPILLPFVLGFLLAYFLNPVADRLEAAGLRRTFGVALIIAFTMAFAIAAVTLLLPLLFDQLKQMLAALPSDLDRLRASVDAVLRERTGARYPSIQEGINKMIADLQANLGTSLGGLATWIWNGGTALINLLSLALVTPMVVYYLLVDWHKIVSRFHSWLPRDHADTIGQLLDDVNAAVGAFVRGQGALCLILGIFYAVGLSLLGLRYGVLIGLTTGLLSFVPVVGWCFGVALGLAVTLSQYGSDMTMLGLTFAVFFIGQILEAFLSPSLVGEKIGLHPVWLIFALFAFSYLFGFVGTLIAVPVSAALAVVVRFAFARYLESDVYKGTVVANTGVAEAQGSKHSR